MVLINSGTTKNTKAKKLRTRRRSSGHAKSRSSLSFPLNHCVTRTFVFFGGIGIVLLIFLRPDHDAMDGNSSGSNIRQPSTTFKLPKNEDGDIDGNDHQIRNSAFAVPAAGGFGFGFGSGGPKHGMPGIKHSSSSILNNIQEQYQNWVSDNPPNLRQRQNDNGGSSETGGGWEEGKSENAVGQEQQNSFDSNNENGNSFDHNKSPFRNFDDDYDITDASICKDFDHTIHRPKHGCQANNHTYMVYCGFENLRIDVDKIQMEGQGGEILESVMGRKEEDEFPTYEKGAFAITKVPKFYVPKPYRKNMHYMKDVLDNMIYPTKKHAHVDDHVCVETWEGITMFITRYEYVNLFHTMTDWYNTFLSLPLSGERVRIVFLDGHATGNLDPVWSAAFGQYTYVKHLPKGGICFEKAIFVPPGYVSPIYDTYLGGDYSVGDNADYRGYLEERSNCPNHELAHRFADHILRAYNMQDVTPTPGKVTIIDRQHYVAHPRSDPNAVPRVLTNLKELKRAIRGVPGVTSVSLARFETMSFKEQLQTIRQSHVVIGNHGAGLSHVMFMKESVDGGDGVSPTSISSKLIEFTNGGTDYFAFLANWKQVSFHGIGIDIDTPSLTRGTIGEVRHIVKSILLS